MNQGSSATARALAVTALVAGFLVLTIVVAFSLGGGSDGPNGPLPARQATQKQARGGRAASARFYVVQSGDTLSSIAHRTGVPLVRIQRLNPSVDPQVLISGEKLKLR
jgi:nucleoid-associated protein YgaU